MANLNTEFLQGPAARAVRILSEYLELAARPHRVRIRDTIVVFGSARASSPEEARKKFDQVNEQIRRAGAATPELKAAKLRAETALRLARYYDDAVALARRVTEWSKSQTGSHHFIVCSGESGGMMEAAGRGASFFYKTDSVDDAFEYLRKRQEELYLIPAGLEQIKLT